MGPNPCYNNRNMSASSSLDPALRQSPQTLPKPAIKQPSNPATQRGWLNTFYRYHKGKKLGPYFVRRWKVGGKIHRQYIKPEDVEKVRAQCAAHRTEQKRRKEHNKQLNILLDNFNFLGAMMNRYDARQ